MPDQYIRNPNAFIASNCFGTVLISPEGNSVFLRQQTDMIVPLLELLREPRSLDDLERELQLNSAALLPLLSLLETRHLVLRDTPEKIAAAIPRIAHATAPVCHNIVVGICGAVQAATMIPMLVGIRRALANEVDVVLTEAAARFLNPEALQYFGFQVWSDTFQARRDVNVPHIRLAQKTDLVLVVPATAHALHRAASGACSDLLSLIIAATRAPVVMVPTMNSNMLQFAPIRRNIEKLRSYGIYVVEPGLGCEVSKGQGEELKFCGIGLNEANLVRGIKAIASAHRELARRAPKVEITAALPECERKQDSDAEAEQLQEQT